MIKAICFDFDGVVRKGEYFSDRLPRKYPSVTSEDILSILKNDWKKAQLGKMTMNQVWEKHLKSWKISMNLKQMFEFWFGEEHLDKGIMKIIDKLRLNAKVYLVTNNPAERMNYFDKRDKLFNHFDNIIISSNIGAFKTSKKVANKICELARAKSNEIIVVDNSQSDLSKYEKHGFKTIFYTNPSELKKLL
jgi:HAD superfamily hydrolase (TIGR01549 family)